MGWNEVIAVRNMRSPKLTDKAKTVLMNLATRRSNDGKCCPSQKLISEDTEMPYRCVQRALQELTQKGVIEVLSGRLTGKSNNYKLNLSTDVDNSCEVRQHDVPQVRQTTPRKVRQSPPHDAPKSPARYASVAHEDKSNLENSTQENKSTSVSQYDFTRDFCRTSSNRQLVFISAMRIGLCEDEARRFLRFNQARDWRILAKMDFADAVLRWRDTWQRRDPEGFAYHLQQLRERQRLREEARIRAQIAHEQ